MTLPVVSMEFHSHIGPNLRLTGGASPVTVTVTNGRASVPWGSVAEAMVRGFIISDPSVKFPPSRGAMCPPAPLTPVLYPAAPTPPTPFYPGSSIANNPTDPILLPAAAAPSFRPEADRRPYAVVTLPDSTTINATYPGSNYVEIPEKHIAGMKLLGWTLLSEWM